MDINVISVFLPSITITQWITLKIFITHVWEYLWYKFYKAFTLISFFLYVVKYFCFSTIFKLSMLLNFWIFVTVMCENVRPSVVLFCFYFIFGEFSEYLSMFKNHFFFSYQVLYYFILD